MLGFCFNSITSTIVRH